MAAPMKERARIRLIFENGNGENHQYWYSLDFCKTPTISDVKRDVERKFLHGQESVRLLLQDCELPVWEEAALIRDNDSVTVLTEEKSEKKARKKTKSTPDENTSNAEQGKDKTVAQSNRENNVSKSLTDETIISTVFDSSIDKTKKKKKHKKRKRKENGTSSESDDTEKPKRSKVTCVKGQTEDSLVLEQSTTVPTVEHSRVVDVSCSAETVCYVTAEPPPGHSTQESVGTGQQSGAEPFSLSYTVLLGAADMSKRKRIRKRKRRRKSNTTGDISVEQMDTTDKQYSSVRSAGGTDNQSQVSAWNQFAMPQATVSQYSGQGKTSSRKVRHIKFDDTDSDTEVTDSDLCSTKIADAAVVPSDNVNNEQVVKSSSQHSKPQEGKRTSVSDTVIEGLSPIPVDESRFPSLLNRTELNNGVTVFTRPRRGLPKGAVHELSKAAQLNTEATNHSVILVNSSTEKTFSGNKSADAGEVINNWGKPCPQSLVKDRQEGSSSVQQAVAPNFSQCPPLVGPPRVGDKIAYKVLEMSETYTPELSDFKAAEVLSFITSSLTVTLRYLYRKQAQRKLGKFDLLVESEMTVLTNVQEEPEVISLNWSLMQDVRLIS